MNIFLVIFLCIICLGAGWLLGIQNGEDIEKMVDGVEQGVAYLEELDLEFLGVEETSKNIDLLLHLVTNEEEDAKEYLIAILKEQYKEMRTDQHHEALSDEMKIQMDRINTLSQKHDAFKTIVSE